MTFTSLVELSYMAFPPNPSTMSVKLPVTTPLTTCEFLSILSPTFAYATVGEGGKFF